jgi:hypothetical protein
MKKCTYCGKEYPDEATVCPLDQEPLVAQIPPASEVPTVSSATTTAKLELHEKIWIALPIALVAVGGAIGGACGGAAWAANRVVFQKTQNPILRYVFTGLISASAVIVWLLVASIFVSLIKKH